MTLPAKHDNPWIGHVEIRLFLISFVILFLELVCIRWIPSYVRYLSYFSNFILLGAFLGVGIGTLMSRGNYSLLKFFPASFLITAVVVAFAKFELVITSSDALYFQTSVGGSRIESYWLLPLIFSLVCFLFLLLGQELGKLIKVFDPLKAYSLNVLGSLAGIASFFFLSFFSTPPAAWFAMALIPLAMLLPLKKLNLQLLFMISTLALVTYLSWSDYWSPYYRITVTPVQTLEHSYFISVNNVAHQFIAPHDKKEPFYYVPYELFKGQSFKNALIIGAGTGSDASIALANGVNHIDAVEIDPIILRLGYCH